MELTMSARGSFLAWRPRTRRPSMTTTYMTRFWTGSAWNCREISQRTHLDGVYQRLGEPVHGMVLFE